MAGVTRWSAKDVPEVKPAFPVIPPGDTTLKFVASSLEIKVTDSKPAEQAIPYLNFYFENVTGVKARAYHRFLLSTTPSAKGWVGVTASGGITDFLQAAGLAELFQCDELADRVNAEGAPVSRLDAIQAKAFLMSQDGIEVQARIKNVMAKDRDGKEIGLKHEVAFFLR